MVVTRVSGFVDWQGITLHRFNGLVVMISVSHTEKWCTEGLQFDPGLNHFFMFPLHFSRDTTIVDVDIHQREIAFSDHKQNPDSTVVGEVSSMPLSDSHDPDNYVKYPVNTIRGMKRHPVKWPQQIVPLMGIPSVLPVLPITPTPISGFPDTVSISGIDYSIKANHARTPNVGMLPFYHLRNFIVLLVEWCRGDRAISLTTTQIELTLKVGDFCHCLKTFRVIICGRAAYMAYIDAAYRSLLRGLFQNQGVPANELFRRAAAAQNDDALDPYDFAVLLALAQDQKLGGVQPEGGMYTVRQSCTRVSVPLTDADYQTRVLYPSSACDEMIFITARVPEETITALENDEFELRKVEIFKSTALLGSNEDWTESGFLKALVTLTDEIALTAASAVKTRGGFFGDDEDYHGFEDEDYDEPEESNFK